MRVPKYDTECIEGITIPILFEESNSRFSRPGFYVLGRLGPLTANANLAIVPHPTEAPGKISYLISLARSEN